MDGTDSVRALVSHKSGRNVLFHYSLRLVSLSESVKPTPERRPMQLSFSDSDLAFQAEVRDFLNGNLPDDLRDKWMSGPHVFAEPEDSVRWQKILHTRGWVAPQWPVEHGGTGWNVSQKYIFEKETAAAGAPPLMPTGIRMVAPVLMRYGTPEQKAHFLPLSLIHI